MPRVERLVLPVISARCFSMDSLKQYGARYLLTALFLVTVAIWYAVFFESRGGILMVAFLDVGQGDAIFIEAPNGNQVLIDGGAGRAVLRELSRVMPFYDRSIDVVLGTHTDKDHVGGLPAVFENFSVEFYIDPGLPDDSGFYQELLRDVAKEPAEKIIARRGMRINLGEGAELNILFPDRDVSGFDANDASVIARLVYGDTAFLFTGDSPKKIENYVVSLYGDALRSDVLKAGHHGSKTSTSAAFLSAVSPDIAVVSAGEDNRYGHPHKEVTDAFAAAGVSVSRTDKDGTIIFKSDGVRVTHGNP